MTKTLSQQVQETVNNKWTRRDHVINAARHLPRRKHEPKNSTMVIEREALTKDEFVRDVYWYSNSTGEVLKEMTVQVDLRGL